MNSKNPFLTILCILFLLIGSTTNAQNAQRKWGIGLHGALFEPNTNLGSDFFKFKINRDNTGGGISLYRYLCHSFDLGFSFLNGNVSQKKIPFSLTDGLLFADLNVHYKFNNGHILKEDAIVGPYLTAGAGLANAQIKAISESSGLVEKSQSQMDLFGGIGFRFRLSEAVGIDWQTVLHLPSDNTWEGNTNGTKDQILVHSLGLVLNIGSEKENDADGDGVVDRLDKCPNTPPAVKVDELGCPLDRDHDGTADYQDDCPDVAGLANLKGCPDKDSDGIADKNDSCPDQPGTVALNGCPDSDKDGVADILDKCPNTKPGYKVDAKGCPKDSDGDGLVDEEDECPTVKGIASLKGCPDSDNDGVADKSDECPNVPGTIANRGCPEIPKEVAKQITSIASKIFFETGSDQLKTVSKSQLDELAVILKKYADTKLSVEGHTDNVGDAQKNLELSKKRSESVIKYLISKGIDAARLCGNGYGDTVPVADNNTADGRAKNRRVELKTR